MKNKKKIINDPVHGFITIPNSFIYDLVQHPFVQRLNRIKQLGVSAFVYPGATHTRFQHSLGAMFLTNEAIKELRSKGNEITEEEANGTLAAILLHDIGHTPFSHLLEKKIVENIDHETITEVMMQKINSETGGKLNLAIDIFKNKYHKKFLHQLISSQLDMDRMDYLARDSFFTGVVEGAVGSARIIKMLDVMDDNLVVEKKGIYSIENYLIARRFMYWQVYLHKTAIAAEMMLVNIIERAKQMCANGCDVFSTPQLKYFLNPQANTQCVDSQNIWLEKFALLDDSDIIASIKVWTDNSDTVLRELSNCFINRRLFKTVETSRLDAVQEDTLKKQYAEKFDIPIELASYFFRQHTTEKNTYNIDNDEIVVRTSLGNMVDISTISNIFSQGKLNHDIKKHYLCYYKL